MTDLAGRVNWVDLLIVILLIRACYVGASRGFGPELFGAISTFVALFVSIFFFIRLEAFLKFPKFLPPALAASVLFFVLALLVLLIFRIIGSVLENLMKVEFHSVLDRIGGVIFSVIRSSLWISLALIALIALPSDYLERSIKYNSVMGNSFLMLGPTVYKAAEGYINKSGASGKDALFDKIEEAKARSGKIKLFDMPERKEAETVPLSAAK